MAKDISYYNNYDFLLLDESSKRTLEVVKGLNTFTKKGSLLDVLDKCSTSMGSRKLKKWVESPLVDLNKIEERQNIIESFTKDLLLQDKIEKILREVYDIERLVVKISNGSINPRELYSLKSTIENANKIKAILENQGNNYLKLLSKEFIDLSDVYGEIDKVLIENPPVVIEENRIIKEGYSSELDDLFKIATEGKNWLLDFEEKERNRTGIKKLKVKHNKILGYFIEVTKSFLDHVPEDYIRKQTLVGSERFFSMELKDMEGKLLGSKERALSMQAEIYNNLKDFIGKEIYRIQILADKLSKLDSLLSLAKVSNLNNYVRPKFNNEGYIEIKAGRHPIVESYMKDDFFVPNDTYIDTKNNMIHIITGPNMAGKSTYMRQVALITIMAHIGCFVPCDSCNISLIDRIFTRIGASDNLAMGQSTFMVEMTEVANILRNATSKSLIILDEIGRGTSTFDGLSIAWAVVEYIANTKILGAKTLFATHYHELTELEGTLDGVNNYCIAVKECGDDIVFLRKIIKGGADKSYGIQVAKLAGVPETVLNRAKELVAELSDADISQKARDIAQYSKKLEKMNNQYKKINDLEDKQMSLFDTVKDDDIISDIKELDISNMTPIDALNTLYKLQGRVKNRW